MKKFAPLIAGILLISLSGCVSNSRESGKRTNILFGLVDYKSNYTNTGYIYDPADAGILSASTVVTKPTGSMTGYTETVNGKRLSILWGLGGVYKWE